MLALGRRMLGTRCEAEDILHNVFLEAWRHAGDYDGTRGSVKAWLLLRMRSRCLDRLRSHGYARSAGVTEARLGACLDTQERHLDASRARSTLEDLSPLQRQVLELGYLHGFSLSEIAAALGVPLGTVKSRTASAMKQLRAMMRCGRRHGRRGQESV